MRKLNGLSIIENDIAINDGDSIQSTKERKRILSSIREYRDPRVLLIIKSLELTKKRELIIKSSKQTLKEGKNVSPMKEY